MARGGYLEHLTDQCFIVVLHWYFI